MSADAFETVDSRDLSIDFTDRSADTTELKFTVCNVADGDEALAAALAIAPTTFRGLLPRKTSVEPTESVNVYQVKLSYTAPSFKGDPTPDVGDETFSFDTGGATQLITHTAQTQRVYDASGELSADPFGGAINAKRDGKVEGVEIGIPALNFQIRRRFANGVLTFPYLRKLVLSSYSTNNAPFRGFAAGEVLFTHASGSDSRDGDPEITFNFIGSPNLSSFTLGDVAVAMKKGHEYLWVYYEDGINTTYNLLRPKVKYVAVAPIYKSTNFATLGISVV